MSCKYFFTKFCQLGTFKVKIQNLVKFLGHLPGACILQTRVKMTNLAIPIDWLDQFTSNFVKMSHFMKILDFLKKILVLVCKIHKFGWSVKYTFQLFQISTTTSAFDLKFSPVIGIDHIRPLAKFQVGHVTSWYFTDRSVNYLLSAILSDLVFQSTWNFHKMFRILKCVSVPNFKLVTWLVGILQTRPE